MTGADNSCSVPLPVCGTCADSHRMTLGERTVPCTFCPRPCEECRAFYQGARLGAYCETTPCLCRCHKPCLCGPPKDKTGRVSDQKIIAAGVWHEGVVYQLPPPARHHNIFEHMREAHGVTGRIASEDTGFILECGIYVRRRAAERIAFKTGQVKQIIGGVLTSEDLW